MDRHFPLSEAERQTGDSQSLRVRGNLCPRDCILHQMVSMFPFANQVFQGSWTVDIHEGHSQRIALQRTHMLCTQETEGLGLRGDKMHHPPGRVHLPST